MKVFLLFLLIDLFLQQHETPQESFLKQIPNQGKDSPQSFETDLLYYNFIFSMVVLILILQISTTHCNQK